jgi:hypothetical protein
VANAVYEEVTKMRRTLLALIACVAVLAGAGPANAHRQAVSDPADTPGRLDIKRAVVSHEGTGGNGEITFRLGTYEEWAKRAVRPNRGVIRFNIRRSPESSWLLEIHKFSGQNRLIASIVMCIEGQGCDLENGSTYFVQRPNRKSAKVTVDRSDLGGIGPTMRWRAVTAYRGRNCNGFCFIDTAPNNGLAEHQL